MRTTVTLDDDVVAALRAVERERGVSFKEALNSAVRVGLSSSGHAPSRPFSLQPFHSEIQPGVDLRRSNRLLDDLEDEGPVRDPRDDDFRRFPGVRWHDPLS